MYYRLWLKARYRVATGNFMSPQGFEDILAGYYAMKMGLPVEADLCFK